MIPLFNALGFIAALAWSFSSSGSETALYRTSRVRLRVREDGGEAAAAMVSRLLNRIESLVTAILISNNIANYLGTYFLTTQLMALRAPQYELLTTLIVTPLFFVVGESLPKQLAYHHADSWALAAVRPLSIMRHAFAPAVWALNAASAVLRRLLRIKGDGDILESRRTRLIEYFEACAAENILPAEQIHMAKRIIEFEGITASAVMVPTAKILVLPGKTTRSRAASEISRRKTSFALLVDSAGRITDRIVTVSLLIQTPGAPTDQASKVAPSLGTVSSGASLPEILLRFRQEHAQRVAVKERGRIVGVITTHSILARIAGDARE